MFRNYIKTAWRHITQNKGLSAINIFGLATGMAFAILIGLWVQFETSFDDFEVNRDRIAVVLKNTFFNNEKNTMEASPLPLYYELKENYPEVKRATRLNWPSSFGMMVGEKKINENGLFVDPAFLKMFTLHPLRGDLETALNDPQATVITESVSKKLFGEGDAVGKMIRLNNDFTVKVSSVISDLPKNSSIQFDFLMPYEHLMEHDDFIKNNKTDWGNNFMRTMVELKEGTSMENLSRKIRFLNVTKDPKMKNMTLFLHPMSKWHLRNEYKNYVNMGGKIEYVRLFAIIGIFVLLIACINFMNLSTARSEKRAREVGIRKSIGSRRSELILQFLIETLLTSVFAFVLAIIIIPLALPLLKDLGFENIHFQFTNLPLLASVFGIAVITGLIAGSYPALYLSSFIPVRVLKGVFRQSQGAVAFRKTLVISQFAISIGLIISTFIVFRQIDHAKSRPIGYDRNNLISLHSSPDIQKNYSALKRDLLGTGYVEAVTQTSNPLTAVYNSWGDFDWTGKDPNAQIGIDAIMTEWDYEKTVGLQFVAGRPFSPEYKTDSNAVILNEAALKVIGYKDPVGKTMKSGDRVINIVGVVKDMVLQDPFKPVHPTAILFNANSANFVFLRFKKGKDLKASLGAIQPLFEKYNPSFPFEYFFADEEYARKFYMENQVGKLAAIFAVLAILISCLGLYGLASFMAERRTKEIGIRKVLGASVLNLWALLSAEFIWLVMAGCLIASPVSFWLMRDWLQKYDYRINISWWIFLFAAGMALAIALITVSTQAIKAALNNPVKSLRSE